MEWKVDETYDDFWKSFFFAVSLCALLVSIINFYIIIIIFVVILLLLHIYAASKPVPKRQEIKYEIKIPSKSLRKRRVLCGRRPLRGSRKFGNMEFQKNPVKSHTSVPPLIPNIVVEDVTKAIIGEAPYMSNTSLPKHAIPLPWRRNRSFSCPNVSEVE